MYINESVNNDTKTDRSLNDQAISVILKAGRACFKIRATTIRKKNISNFYLTGSAGSKLDSGLSQLIKLEILLVLYCMNMAVNT